MPFITVIFFGILAASFALVLELLFFSFIIAPTTFESAFSFIAFLAILGVSLIEEISKYLFLGQYTKRFPAGTTPTPGRAAVFGAFFGVGFAITEITLAANTGALPALAFPSITTVHIFTGILFSLFLFSSLAKNSPFSKKRLLASYLIATAVLVHTLYNTYVLLFA